MRYRTGLIAIAVWLALGACAELGQRAGEAEFDQDLAAEVLSNELLCGDGLSRPDALWIDDQATLEQYYARIVHSEASPTPIIDFASDGVLIIAMGRQPSSGYRLNHIPRQQAVRSDGDTLEVAVSWQEPEPGSEQAQITTNPCLLLVLPKADFERLRIVDQSGAVRLTAPRERRRAAGS